MNAISTGKVAKLGGELCVNWALYFKRWDSTSNFGWENHFEVELSKVQDWFNLDLM